MHDVTGGSIIAYKAVGTLRWQPLPWVSLQDSHTPDAKSPGNLFAAVQVDASARVAPRQNREVR